METIDNILKDTKIDELQFSDLFSIDELQLIQDQFSNATGVSSIITKPDGTPITQPSNFCRLCSEVIRGTEKGFSKCMQSDAELGKQNPRGAKVQACLSGGLWDAGASITVGGKHLANWLIGQIRNEELDDNKIEQYADEIGVDREIYKAAYLEVPVMTSERFKHISDLLFNMANNLSQQAYQNKQYKHLILKQKRIEEKLRLSEEKYRLLVENQNDLVVKIDKENKLNYVSPSYCKLFGKEESELIGKSFLPLVHSDDLEETKKTMQQLYIPPYTCKVVQRAMTIKGWRWLSWSDKAVLDKNGEIEAIIGVGRDITVRKMAEQKLEASEEKYRTLIENSMIGAIQTTLDEKLIFANKAALKMFEFGSDHDFSSYQVSALYKNPQERIQIINSLQENGHIENAEVTFITNKGNERNILMSLAINGDQINGTIIDITERKLAELAIKEKNEQLRANNIEKDKFFSIIAHDLRSPFNSFLGLTQIMAEDLPNMTLDQIQKLATSMKNTAGKVNRLLENLLNWARMRRDMFPFSPQQISSKQLFGHCSENCNDLAVNKSVSISIDCAEDIEIYADINMIQTVLRNLVSNAVKFTNPGGKVMVKASKIDTDYVLFEVSDTGIGMSKSIINNLFRMDVNTNRQGTEGELSTGLGLILCKEFVEKHNGKIWAESIEQKGSTFYFTLPSKQTQTETN